LGTIALAVIVAAVAAILLTRGDDPKPVLPVTPGPSPGARGAVLAGTELKNQVYADKPSWSPPDPKEAHYPKTSGKRHLPRGEPRWRGIAGLSERSLVHATDADAKFNDEDARYELAFHLSHYGGMPDNAGDFNDDGVDDFITTCHFCYVDGKQYAGEVHIYYGRKGGLLDPTRQVPDVIFYGDEAGAKLGLSVLPAGDLNRDGKDDIAMSASFHSTRTAEGKRVQDGGEVYVVYGGYLDRFRSPVKVRVQSIGRRVPGLVLQGGSDGRSYVAWANGLDAGDFNGDGVTDLLIGAYDPYPALAPDFPARGYLVYGSRSLPRRLRGYPLGKGGAPIRSAYFDVPRSALTYASLGFGTFFVGDLNRDGRDEISFTVDRGGSEGRGGAYVFFGRSGGLPGGKRTPLSAADLVVSADESRSPPLRVAKLQGTRPAGDFNGDGVGDMLLLARGTSYAGQTVGAAGVLLGRRGSSRRGRLRFSRLRSVLYGKPGRLLSTVGHPAMDRAADFDRDGFSDLLINDPYYLENIAGDRQQRGRVWLIRGSKSPPRFATVQGAAALEFLPDNRIPGMFGFTWNTGDWNGDGWPDVVIGDHYAGDAALHEHRGKVYMFYNRHSFRAPAG
jgi:FG-GAP repeat